MILRPAVASKSLLSNILAAATLVIIGGWIASSNAQTGCYVRLSPNFFSVDSDGVSRYQGYATRALEVGVTSNCSFTRSLYPIGMISQLSPLNGKDRYEIAPNSGVARTGAVTYTTAGAQAQVIFEQAAAVQVPIPSIDRQGVVSVAGPIASPGLTPLGWVSVYGKNLSTSTRQWSTADFRGNDLPTQLDGVGVTVNGKAAYVGYISPTQINVQVPDDTSRGLVEVRVSNGAGTSAVEFVNMSSSAPTLKTFDQYAAAQHADGTIVSPVGKFPGSTEARRGEQIVIYALGMGSTNPVRPAGQLVSGAPLSDLNAFQLTIGGMSARVIYAGLTSGAGLYQVNAIIPSLPDGDHPVFASISGVRTQAGVSIPIQGDSVALTVPFIAAFSASPSTIQPGQAATLSWSVGNATNISINNGIGTVTGTSRSVSPSVTTAYTLTATNAAGSTTAQTTVIVGTVAAPPTISFSASPTAIQSGQESTLSWNVLNASSVMIDNQIGSVAPTGSRSVQPSANTTYNLTATGSGGTRSMAASVSVSSGSPVSISFVNRLAVAVDVFANGGSIGIVPAGSAATLSTAIRTNLTVSWRGQQRTTSTGTPVGVSPESTFPVVPNVTSNLSYRITNRAENGDSWFMPVITNRTSTVPNLLVNGGFPLIESLCCGIPGTGNPIFTAYFRQYRNSNVRLYESGTSGRYWYWGSNPPDDPTEELIGVENETGIFRGRFDGDSKLLDPFVVSSRNVTIQVWDHSCEDGDSIRVTIGGVVVFNGVVFNTKRTINYTLPSNDTTIEVFANNGGTDCPAGRVPLDQTINSGAISITPTANGVPQEWRLRQRGATSTTISVR